VSEPSLPEKIVALHEALAHERIGHAFGGALALAYYAEPRATVDIDVNVFVPPSRLDAVVDALTPLGVTSDVSPAAVERDGQCRLWWGRTPVDVFFAYDDIHDAMRRSTRNVPFGAGRIPVLGPEHLVVCKAVFDRPKDWIDIEQVAVTVDALDVEEIRRRLAGIVGPDDARARKLEKLLARLLGG
jgi:hypothetical protein